jgi:hypothetical protein
VFRLDEVRIVGGDQNVDWDLDWPFAARILL